MRQPIIREKGDGKSNERKVSNFSRNGNGEKTKKLKFWTINVSKHKRPKKENLILNSAPFVPMSTNQFKRAMKPQYVLWNKLISYLKDLILCLV